MPCKPCAWSCWGTEHLLLGPESRWVEASAALSLCNILHLPNSVQFLGFPQKFSLSPFKIIRKVFSVLWRVWFYLVSSTLLSFPCANCLPNRIIVSSRWKCTFLISHKTEPRAVHTVNTGWFIGFLVMNKWNCPQIMWLKSIKWMFHIYPKLLAMEKTKHQFKKGDDLC